MRSPERIRNRDRDSGVILPTRNLLWSDLLDDEEMSFFIPEPPDDDEDEKPRWQRGFDHEN